jgi:PA14 domain/Sulfatase/Chitobiase/beta-hexosaminidase C-terminal domain
MKKNIFSAILALGIFLLNSNFTNAAVPAKIKRVVIIGCDGMSVGGVLKANTPNFDKFMNQGAYTLHARNIFPTVSSPNWEAMLTGSNATQTGVTSNDWELDNYQLPPVVTTENGRYPDIFYILKKFKPQLKTASVYDWSGFGRLYDKTCVDIDIHPEGVVATAQRAAEVIKKDKPDFLFIHFDNVDHAGHADGHMTSSYFKAVSLADSLAGVVVAAAKEAGTFDETLFIVTADHGGVGNGHGDMTVQGNEVPFLMYGAGVKKGYQLPVAVNLMDLAATVAYTFDVPVPQVWVGRPVASAFAGSPEPDARTLAGKFLSPYNCTPVILPANANGTSGGLYIGKKALVTIKTDGTDGAIRYTTDGTIPTKNSKAYSAPFELEHSGVVRAVYFGNDGSHTTISEGYFRVVKDVVEKTGVAYKIYKGENWNKLPAFAFLKPVSAGKVFEITTDQLADQLGENTAVVFEGVITIQKEGKYQFFIASDDGSKLYIDDKELIDNDGDHGTKEASSSVKLAAGKHKIRVEYFNGGGGFFLTTGISGDGIPKQIISPEYLTID